MIRDHERERRFTIALASALAATLVVSTATAVALRSFGASTVLTGHGAVAGSNGGSVIIPGSSAAGGGPAGAGGSAGGGGGGGGGSRPVIQGSAGPLAVQGVSGGVIHLGSVITQTGPGRSITMAHALVAWEKTINDSGGINGNRVSIDIKDDQGNSDLGASQYRQLNDDEHVFALVAECAPITDAQQVDYIRSSGLPVIGECQSSPAAYSLPTLFVGGPTPYQNGQLGALLMQRVKGWGGGGGRIALVCLNDPSTKPVCDGVAARYGTGAIWHGGPQMEQITDNNFSQLISQWQSDGVQDVHLVLDPGSVQRYLYAAQSAGFSAPTMNNLIVDDGDAGSYSNAEGMMNGTPWVPLDRSTPEMTRFRAAMARYFPDDRIDLYAQTGWISAIILEHALRLMGGTITRDNLITTLNTQVHNWDTQFGPVENYSPQVHTGPFESALMAVNGAGSPSWHMVTVHAAITG